MKSGWHHKKYLWPRSILARILLPLPLIFATLFLIAAILAQRPHYKVKLVNAIDHGWVQMEFDVEILSKRGLELETSYENQYPDAAIVIQLYNEDHESVFFNIHLEPCSSSHLRSFPTNTTFLGRADSAGKFDFDGYITKVKVQHEVPKNSINYWGLAVIDSIDSFYAKIPGRPKIGFKLFRWLSSVFEVKGELEPFRISDHLDR